VIFAIWSGVRSIYIAIRLRARRVDAAFRPPGLHRRRAGRGSIVGNFIASCSAVTVLVISVVAFPLLVVTAGRRSRSGAGPRCGVRRQSVMIAGVGLDRRRAAVARLVPFFFRLAVVVPVLGHSTWHLLSQCRGAGPDPSPTSTFRRSTPLVGAIFPPRFSPARTSNIGTVVERRELGRYLASRVSSRRFARRRLRLLPKRYQGPRLSRRDWVSRARPSLHRRRPTSRRRT